ncbi:hypothetical protein BDF14DRAFT_1720092, partial [Spinellus fusiger]
KCFVSLLCKASSDINTRDLKDDPDALKDIKDVQRNTQSISSLFSVGINIDGYTFLIDMINLTA